jgi:mRNA-degrading endonuclease toxin of MazEF toxin-antitoxin module
VVISADAYNTSRAGMVIALPLTARVRRIAGRVPLAPPEGGLKSPSDILCDQVRALSHARLLRRWGEIPPTTLATVEAVLRVLMGL